MTIQENPIGGGTAQYEKSNSEYKNTGQSLSKGMPFSNNFDSADWFLRKKHRSARHAVAMRYSDQPGVMLSKI